MMLSEKLPTKPENFSPFKQLLEELSKNKAVELDGLVPGAKYFWLAGLGRILGQRILVVSPGIAEAEKAAEDIKFFLKGACSMPERPAPLACPSGSEWFGAYNFPAREILPKEKNLPHRDIIGEQLRVLKVLTEKASSSGQIFTASAKSFYHNLLSPTQFKHLSLEIEKGKDYDLGQILEKLDKSGYEHLPLTEEKGNFSMRGGIVDVFPLSEENPCRIEFFGDRAESIRYFDPLSQRSLEKINKIFIPPAVIQGKNNFLDFLKGMDLVVLDEALRIKEQLSGECWQKLSGYMAGRKKLLLFTISQSLPEVKIDSKLQINSQAMELLWKDFSAFLLRLKSWQEENFKVFLISQNEGEKLRLKELLNEKKIKLTDFTVFSVGQLNRGFLIPDLKLAVVTDREIFHRYGERRPRQRFKGGRPLSTYRELKKGDLVVHLNYGIGRFRGIEKLKIEAEKKDFLAIEYQNRDILYVPIEEVRLVQKYIGFEGGSPKLYKLGGSSWFKVLKRTKTALRDMASELLALNAKRQAKEGFAFSKDTNWQKEFEAAFIYEETPDQRQAIKEVKSDLEQARPMDRLVCGDVGYGKTEVAVRAAFKAACEGKQTGMLVPTTILARQHYLTFSERMADYPIGVEMLSRFRNPGEQEEIIKKLKEGKIDIVIGTHRLLQEDVKFKDLGLLIIDEEQRFGVSHKEKIKRMRQLVDVLTLSATPIPRTLYMSLAGVRDLSIIETPPRDRLPVQTYVLEYDEKVICEAVKRELAREGQVFFVFNRIDYIHKAAARLQELLPEIKIAIAHGRLNEKELEEIMRLFIDGKIDVLVSTTIIESGLDIGNVNTIIITNAHRYGLANLYQLRGRVGRYKHRAYAYFFIPKGKLITPEAVKRLKTMEEFTELGAGIRIAMRDLEIRGAGNILGPQQHGFMAAVGFDLYCRLLQESVRQLKGEKVSVRNLETKINLVLPEYIPDEYIAAAETKVEIYAKISSLSNQEELNDLIKELIDRFGPLPEEMRILLDLAQVRIEAGFLGIEKIYIHKKKGTVNIQFHPQYGLSLLDIEKMLKRTKTKFAFQQDKDNRIILELKWRGDEDKAVLPFLKKLLQGQ